jgi:membrane protease YdiL (CAAX protease family)
VFISLAVMFGLSGVLGAIAAIALDLDPEELDDPASGGFLLLLVLTWISFLAWPAVIMFWKGTGRPSTDFGLSFKWIDLAWGFGGFALFLGMGVWAGILWTLFNDEEIPTNSDMIESDHISAAMAVVLFVGIAVITPVVEELWFRGFMRRAVDRRFGLVAGLLSSSLLFGVLHLDGASLGDVWVVGLLSMFGGVLASLTVVTDGRLGAAIIAHALNNALTFAIVVL